MPYKGLDNINFDKCIKSACKENRVQQPGASGFCYQASDFCS